MHLNNQEIISILNYINQFRTTKLSYINNDYIRNNTKVISSNYMGKYCYPPDYINLIKLIIDIWKNINHNNFMTLIDSQFLYFYITFIHYKKNNKDQITINIILN